MKINLEAVQEKVQPAVGALSSNKYLKSVMGGMMGSLPIIMVGAFATLLTSIPITPYLDFIKANGIFGALQIISSFTTNAISLYIVVLIAYNCAKVYEVDDLASGLLGLLSFLIVTPLGNFVAGKSTASAITFDWLGAKGMFAAIIIGLFVGRIYALFIQKGFAIKMPEGVPPMVTKSFAGLVPAFALVIFFLVVKVLFDLTTFGSFHQFIYTFVQTPLTGLGGSLGAFVLAMFVGQLLWWFGIHGTLIIYSILGPIWMSMDLANLNAAAAGQPLPNILGLGFWFVYVLLLGGSGCTLGLNLLYAFRAKSQRFKLLGRMALPAAICSINEPLQFGTPMILNPLMLLPMVFIPALNSILAFAVTAIGIVPHCNGMMLALGIPVVISGFLEGSWRIAALQVVLVFLDTIIYFPFFAIADKQAKAEETAGTTAEANA